MNIQHEEWRDAWWDSPSALQGHGEHEDNVRNGSRALSRGSRGNARPRRPRASGTIQNSPLLEQVRYTGVPEEPKQGAGVEPPGLYPRSPSLHPAQSPSKLGATCQDRASLGDPAAQPRPGTGPRAAHLTLPSPRT